MMKRIIDHLVLALDNFLLKIKARAMRIRMANYPHIHKSVKFGSNVKLIGPSEAFIIGEGTYINDAILAASNQGKITIGINCAIGYRVSIKAVTHDVMNPCKDEQGNFSTVAKDITIGDACWIGDNVFIREGVSIGDNVVVGANSVVTKSFQDNVVIVGSPAVVIRHDKRTTDC